MRIHICGIYGSGKSTLAKEISKKLRIKVYSLDDIKYKVKYSKIRSVEERIRKSKEISDKNAWITEGTWSDYASHLFFNADMIIFMETPKLTCCYRILKRYFKRKKQKNDTFWGALKLSREVFHYYSKDRPVSLKAHHRLIDNSKRKVFFVKNNSDIQKLISQLN